MSAVPEKQTIEKKHAPSSLSPTQTPEVCKKIALKPIITAIIAIMLHTFGVQEPLEAQKDEHMNKTSSNKSELQTINFYGGLGSRALGFRV